MIKFSNSQLRDTIFTLAIVVRRTFTLKGNDVISGSSDLVELLTGSILLSHWS